MSGSIEARTERSRPGGCHAACAGAWVVHRWHSAWPSPGKSDSDRAHSDRPSRRRCACYRNYQLRAAAKKLERSHVSSDPTGQLLIQRSLDIGVVAGSQHSYEQLRRVWLAGCWIVDGHGRSRPIHKQLLPWPMGLAQYQIALLLPVLVVMTETAVPIAVFMRGSVLFPQQLQGGVLVLLQLLINVGEIRWVLLPRP
jgi:hypothetical protein